jgi:lactate racemase
MDLIGNESIDSALSNLQLEEIVQKTISQLPRVRRVLLIHPDYSRHDFTEVIAPMIYRALEEKGLEQLDTLNASGTHREMSEAELVTKLGMLRKDFPRIGQMYNHQYDDPDKLVHVVDIPAGFVKEKTAGHLTIPLAVTVNRLLTEKYDAVITISGTVPHEGTGYSGGTKILFPGVSGPEVIGLFHWAAVLIGIPTIIGMVDNAARDVVDEGAKHIFKLMGERPVVSFNMVNTEDDRHEVVPNGLFTGIGLEGFRLALRAAAKLSSQVHVAYIDEAKDVIVQQIPRMYDEVWTAGKGSYKLQRPGVVASGGEIILYAPHIHCFHSNKKMDQAVRQIGYHGRDWVVRYCKEHPEFNKNVASHVINVRGLGSLVDGVEAFPFKVTLATQISEADCRAVGLGYCAPESLREEDFARPRKLWIREGGQRLISKR